MAKTPKIAAMYTYDDEQVQVFGLRFYPYEPPNDASE